MKESKYLYDYPVYYETAFSFRDIPKEVEFFDECIRQYSRIPVRKVLELGAGTAPHMQEWARRKIEYVGIDTNENMQAKIEVRFRTEVLDRAAQTVRNTLTANIDDGGKLLKLDAEDIVRTIFPQEFLLLVERSKKFEFLGWWNNWKLEAPIREATRIARPIVLLRRITRDLLKQTGPRESWKPWQCVLGIV